MKVVINAKFGGFGLSHAAYEKLIEWGVPVRGYTHEKRDPETRRYLPEPANEGEIIFDRRLTPRRGDETELSLRAADAMERLCGTPYWDSWTKENRAHPLVIRLVEELGSEAASGRCAKLEVVEIPDDVEWQVDEYDGNEWVAEKHRRWP